MRTLTIILLAIVLVSLNSCNQKNNSQALLENAETRSEIFTDIVDNSDYMTEFMAEMHNSDHAMQMIQDDKKMVGNMMHGEGMQMMTKNMMGNKSMMHSMMNRMMNDGNYDENDERKRNDERGLQGVQHKDDEQKGNGYAEYG